MANTKSIALVKASSQYLSITDANQTGLDLTGDCSFEAWIKYDTLQNGDYRYIITKRYASTNNRSYAFGLVDFGSYIQIRFFYSPNGLSATEDYKQSNNITTMTSGTWYHVAVTLDISAHTAIFYLNGSAVGTDSAGDATSIYDSSANVTIGNIQDLNANNFWDGKLDEIIVWNDIRTPTEIAESYNSGAGKEYVGNEAGMVAYWRFEDDLLDMTANNNDLTNNNSATFSTDVPFSSGTAYTKDLNENITLVVILDLQTVAKKLFETITIVDNFLFNLTKSFTENIGLVATINNASIMVKQITETVTLDELLGVKQTGKGINENILLTDSIDNLLVINKIISETIALVESFVAGKYYVRTLNETINIIDAITNVLTAGIRLIESLSLKDRLFGLLNGINMKYNRKYSENKDDYVDKYNDL